VGLTVLFVDEGQNMSRTLLFRSAPAMTREAKSSAPGVEVITVVAIPAVCDREPDSHRDDRNANSADRFSEQFSDRALHKPARKPIWGRANPTLTANN
jgi:hypothetical protein